MMTPHAVEERPYTLEVAGREVAHGTCSPDALHALAAGRLLAEGLLDGRAVAAIDVDERASVLVLCVDLRDLNVGEARAACNGRPTFHDLPRDALHDLFRDLFHHADERHPQGGVHVAALSDGERLLHVQTDVGRHNAVDKTIGAARLIDTDMRGLGLVLSARVSGEIARKAAAAGVAWIATRSVPTTLALDVARVGGIAIIARAPSKEPFVWQPGDVT